MKTIIAAYSQNQSGSRASVQAALRTLLDVPWPSPQNVKACIQLLSVLQWVLSFLLMGTVFLLLFTCLFFTSFWPIPALYMSWLIFDWGTPEKGGRSSSWVRKWTIWNHFRDYFPVQLKEYCLLPFAEGCARTFALQAPILGAFAAQKLVKTHNLLPSHNYIVGIHPHGILCVGAFCNFVTRSTGFCEKFPGIKVSLAVLAGNFRLPVFREYLMSGGMCPVTRQAIGHLLSKNGTGNAVVIAVGGAAESLTSRPGLITLTLKNRKGFVRMALQHGAHLVPSFSFGENDLFQQAVFEEGSRLRSFQNRFQKLLGFAPCFFYGRGFTSVHSRGFLPFPRPVTTVIGEPVTVPKIERPSSGTVDAYHAMYVQALLKLFNDHKAKYGLSETDKLQIL